MNNPLGPEKSDINSASPEEQSRIKHLSGSKSSLEQAIDKYHWEGLKHEYIRGITLVQAGFSKVGESFQEQIPHDGRIVPGTNPP